MPSEWGPEGCSNDGITMIVLIIGRESEDFASVCCRLLRCELGFLGIYASPSDTNTSDLKGPSLMPPAARIADMHTCPLSTGPVPHVGGPIMLGCPTVLIGGMPAARVGDMVVCCGPPDTIAMGSTSVLIGGMPAARMGDMCAHGGSITLGFPLVNIGG